MVVIFAGTNGYFDGVPVNQVRKAEAELITFMNTRFGNILATIREKKTLDDTLKGQMNAALKEFSDAFMAMHATVKV